MKLTFLGTRANIEARTRRHSMHTSLLVSYYGKSVMIDCGEDWLGTLDALDIQAIVITHAHPDHAFGLQEGAPCPVYAAAESWEALDDYPIKNRRVIEPRQSQKIAGITFEAFSVDHSTLAPAVGYRISAGRRTVFYVPDVVYIHERAAALSGASLYIGDGVTLSRSMVHKPEDELIGHTPIRTQLTWCQKEGVPKMLVTHCGSQIVEGDENYLKAKLNRMAKARGVEVEIAYDSLDVILR
jgi:ribonuclease BN (tRNA processing enzyme)